MTREIILDTETTGLNPLDGDRIVEIAAIEMLNGSTTDRYFHQYVNPERDIPDSAFKVHGIAFEMVAGQPKFAEIADRFLMFIGNDSIVAHNAEFDLKFINSELKRADRPIIPDDRVIDTLSLARKKHPGTSNSLDALCARYGIDRSRRIKHGALIDAEILAEVYIELTGGRQTSLALQIRGPAREIREIRGLSERKTPLTPILTTTDEVNHETLVQSLGSNALWRRYLCDERS